MLIMSVIYNRIIKIMTVFGSVIVRVILPSCCLAVFPFGAVANAATHLSYDWQGLVSSVNDPVGETGALSAGSTVSGNFTISFENYESFQTVNGFGETTSRAYLITNGGLYPDGNFAGDATFSFTDNSFRSVDGAVGSGYQYRTLPGFPVMPIQPNMPVDSRFDMILARDCPGSCVAEIELDRTVLFGEFSLLPLDGQNLMPVFTAQDLQNHNARGSYRNAIQGTGGQVLQTEVTFQITSLVVSETAVVPLPPALLFFASSLGLLLGFRSRSN